MAIPQDTSVEGMRSSITKSVHGRNLGFNQGNAGSTDPLGFLVGVKDLRVQLSGVSSAGSSLVSTSVTNNIDPFGLTLVGATGASATTAYLLAAPIPGVRKMIFNPTTGTAVVLTTAAGAFMMSTANSGSTLGIATLTAKGSFLELMGVTTGFWAVIGISQISTGGVGVTLI